MEQSKVEWLGELLMTAGRLSRVGEILFDCLSRLRPEISQMSHEFQSLVYKNLEEWNEFNQCYESLCADLWVDPIPPGRSKGGWTPAKIDDVVRAIREGHS